MNAGEFDVAIIGGGIGGLCLAQGLKKAGMEVRVYERDARASARPQGFRIHIDPRGSTALHQSLPPEAWEIFDRTQGEFSQGFTVVTEQLEELLSMTGGSAPPDPIARHRSISRITLKGVLLSGLSENVHFGKRFVRYEELQDGRLRAHFEDGDSTEAAILVGADGVNSAVRKQFLPQAGPFETGVVALGGKVPLTDGALALAPNQLLDGPVMVIPPQPCSLFMAIWKRQRQARETLRQLGMDEAAAEEEDYLVLGLGGSAEYFGLEGEVKRIPGSELKPILRQSVRNWHPNLRKLAEMLNDEEVTANPIRSSQRVAPWETRHITLLGDAIHSMTPYRGIGANIALGDAALLCSKLVEAQAGRKTVLQAISEYEQAMRQYGFEAVEASLKSMEQAVSRKRNPGFGLAKTAMRVMNRVPALKRRLIPA